MRSIHSQKAQGAKINLQANNLMSALRAGSFHHCSPLSMISPIDHTLYYCYILLRFLQTSAITVCLTNEISLYYKHTFQNPVPSSFPLFPIPFTFCHPWIILPPSYESGKYCSSWMGGNHAGKANK